MANIGGYRGWHLCAEVTGTSTNSISVKAWIHADAGYDCAWGARTMTATCNNKPQSATINAMNNSGNADSNVVYFTFNELNSSTYYTIDFSYDIRANLGKYQDVWTGSLGATTDVLYLWNNINAYQPDRSSESGLIFNLSTSDGGYWSNLTNEPDGFTKPYGTTATISDIRSNITGAHYTSNNVTGNGASSFTWTFTTADWVCALYTDWNTYTISYDANGGSGAPGNQTKTYGTNLTLSSTIPTRTGYTFLGWSTNSGATSASYSAGGTLSGDLSTVNGDTVTLYAIWSINSYYLDLNGWLDGVSSEGLSPYGIATVIVNGTVVGNSVTDYHAKHTYGSTYSISTIIADYGYQYNGVHSGSISGTIGAGDVSVSLDFSTTKPSDLAISGTVNGPFEIGLNWSATGLNCNYVVYANGTQIYSGTNTSFVYSCAEETTYNIYFTATNAGGTTTSSTISLTTPADQAKIRIKQDGVWEKGKTYYKKDGKWVKAKKIYIKVDGQWKINNNYDS